MKRCEPGRQPVESAVVNVTHGIGNGGMRSRRPSSGADPYCTRHVGARLARRLPASRIAGVMLAMCLGLVKPTRAGSPGLSDLVPRDAVAVYFAEHPSSTENVGAPWSTLKLATFVADRANQAGLLSRLDATSRRWIDVAGSASVLFDFPHAVALLDVKAKAGADNGHALASLRAALIIQTQGDNDRIAARIQHLLGVYTNTAHAKLSEHSVDGVTWFSLRDSHLPGWAVIAWGPYGDFYLVTIGAGAFERIVSTLREPKQSLGRDAWFDRAARHPGTFDTSHGDSGRPRVHMRGSQVESVTPSPDHGGIDASYAWYVRFDRLRQSGDAGFDAKVQWIQFSLGLSGVERALWMAGQSPGTGSVEVVGVHHKSDSDAIHLLAGEFAGGSLPKDAVPHQATGFAVIDCNPPDIWKGISNAWLGARSHDARERQSRAFGQVETESGISLERDILPLLKGPVVIHNYPRHALRLPLAWTLLVPIRGESRVLRNRVDRILRATQETLGDGVLLQRDDDKVWHLQYGLAGPALAITQQAGFASDRWLIVSFSPYAVRQNLALLDPH